MPRNASSTYSLPAGNPVVPGTIIATTWANTTLTDIATALTQSLSTDGSTASVSLANKTMAGGTFSSPTVSGLLNLTSGQIAFPAVQNPSSNVNTLDDYEEGTWTPTLTFLTSGDISITYTARVGYYTKIGRVVHLTYQIATSVFTHTTSAGQLIVNSIPFVPDTGINYMSGVFRGALWNVTTSPNFASPIAFVNAGLSYVQFTLTGLQRNNAVDLNVGNHVTGDASAIAGSLTYFTST